LKVPINSSTPIVVMETVEEVRALSLVRLACSQLSLAIFEWSIADGLVRTGSAAPAPQGAAYARPESRASVIPQGSSESDRLARAVLSSLGSGSNPVPMLAPVREPPCTTPPTPSKHWPTSRP
jgi:hypothetical protein